MAVKQYENFRNPVLQGRADRNNLANQRMNTYGNEQQLFAKDPAFATGRMIGQMIVDGYNSRGVSKGMKEMQGVFNSLGQPQQPQETTPQPTTVQPNMSNAITMPGSEGNEILNQPITNPNATLKDIMAQEKRNYRADKYIGSENPGTEAIQSKNDIKAMDQAGNTLDFSNLNKEDVREQVRQQLEANGRTPYQIEQVLGQFDRMYDSKYNKWAEGKVTDLIGKGQKALEDGNYDQAQNWFMAAGKYDPKMASMHMQGLNSMYNRKMQTQAQRDKEYMAGYMRDKDGNLVINPNHPTWNQRKYGGVGGGNRGGSVTAGSGNPNYGEGRWIGRRDAVSKEDYTNALSSAKYYEGKENLSPSEQQALKYAQNVIAQYNSANHGGVRGYNIDSADDVAKYIRGVAYNIKNNPNASGTDILETLRRDGIMQSPYWDDRYLEMLGLSADGTNND